MWVSQDQIVSGFSAWIFWISQQFQKPILFDRETEKQQKDDLTKLVEAVEDQIKKTAEKIEDQTQKITELVELLKPKQKRRTVESKET